MVEITPAALTAFLRSTGLLPYCLPCLATKLAAPEAQVRDAAMALVLGPVWKLTERPCVHCGLRREVLAPRQELQGPQ